MKAKYQSIYDKEAEKVRLYLKKFDANLYLDYTLPHNYQRFSNNPNSAWAMFVNAGASILSMRTSDGTVIDAAKQPALVVASPPPTNACSLASFFHELGHFWNGDITEFHFDETLTSRMIPSSFHIERLEMEKRASRWALERMEYYGVPTKYATRWLTYCLNTYKSSARYRHDPTMPEPFRYELNE